MKATLKFDLPEERDEFTFATHGIDWYLLALDLDQWLRGELKYNVMLDERTGEAYEKVRDKIYELLGERGIDFNDVS